jgi:hypothetical protein
MLQVKALPVAPEKPKPPREKKHVPYRAALVNGIASIACLGLWQFFGRLEEELLYILFRGLAGAFLITSIALACRELVKSPLAEDSTLRRTFFILGIVLLFPSFLMTSYLHIWKPHPQYVSLKRTVFSFGSEQRMLHQDSTPISPMEHRILWMTDEGIDRMSPMELYHYFRTLEEPTFSYNFQDNYEALKDTYRIWVTVNIILFILAILSLITSFFMPRYTVVVTGWSGSDWR